MATVRTGGSLITKAVAVLVLLVIAPVIVDGFLAWLWPLLPGLAAAIGLLVVLLGLAALFLRQLRRNAAR